MSKITIYVSGLYEKIASKKKKKKDIVKLDF